MSGITSSDVSHVEARSDFAPASKQVEIDHSSRQVPTVYLEKLRHWWDIRSSEAGINTLATAVDFQYPWSRSS